MIFHLFDGWIRCTSVFARIKIIYPLQCETLSISAHEPAQEDLTGILYLYVLYNVDRISIYVIKLRSTYALCLLKYNRDDVLTT